MILKQQGSLQWLEFEIFSDFPELVHGIFLRPGGVSQGPYAALNVSFTLEDPPEHVEENRRRICTALQVGPLVSAQQVHGTEFTTLTSAPKTPPVCDGLLTQTQSLPLMVMHADCQSAIFYDPVHQALAASYKPSRRRVHLHLRIVLCLFS